MKYFPPFSFDPVEGRLFRGADELPLTRKAAALLSCLVERAGAWVAKETIMASVWPDTHVQSDNIKVLVREIRLALGDAPKAPLYIRSAPGRGYSFVGPLTDESHGRAEAAAGGPIFVNRGFELAALADALDAARASARRLVIVAGEHGIGKTALCEAFLRGAHAAGPVRVCTGQCLDRQSEPEPYYPFLDALLRLDRRHRGLVPDLLARLAPAWLARFPQWHDRTAAQTGRGMLAQLGDLLDALAHDLPLVMVVENLQWADVDSVRALAHLAARSSPAKLLLVATCRTGEWHAGSRDRQKLLSPFDAYPRKQTLELGPLTAEHVARYVDARFGPDCLTELAASVHQASYGNPHFVVNAFDTLVGRGLVARGADGWRRQAPIAAIARALPETLSESIAQELDHLEPREREVLEAAAAVGPRFTIAVVAAALQTPADAVRAVLAPLARRGQLIVPDGGAGSLPVVPDAYRFRHALHADVIARRAPMMRQLRVSERVTAMRSARILPLKRA
jgi:DNA-binding winged helix-turn-helix (wHTH) protein